MQTVKLTCENCGANLEIKDNIAFCPYCGAKIAIDDGNRTITHRDEARIRDSERKEKVRLKELENEEKQKTREHKEQKWFWIGWAIFMVVLFSIIFIMAALDGPNKNEVKMPCDMSDYKGEQYEAVVQELEDLGFYNIETTEKKDLVTGWITKDGEVYKVSIGGDSDFDEGDIFPKDAEVVVTYHTFKD